MKELETLDFDVQDGVARLTFRRAKKLNAFNQVMSTELLQIVTCLRADSSVRVVVLRGAGGNFMAGADIGMLQEWALLDREVLLDRLLTGFTPTLLEDLPQPVIAAIDGFALGMGCEISLACDFRVITSRAKFGLPEVALGLIPGAGGTQRLPHLIGRTRAAQVVMAGDRIDAEQAEAWGIANRLVEPEEIDEAVEDIVVRLLESSPAGLHRAKRCLVASRRRTLNEGIAFELENFVDAVFSDDAEEGTAAFLEKRRPSFASR